MQLKNKIHSSLRLISLCTALLAVILFSILFAVQLPIREKEAIKTEALIIRDTLAFIDNNIVYLESLHTNSDLRITYIAPDGTVLYDNFISSSHMDNHLSRPEIQNVLENGYADSVRRSETIGKESYYYALALPDNTILRVSQTTDTFFTVMANMIFFVCVITFFVLIISNLFALRMTRGIIEPINNIDLQSPICDLYDELAPFIKKINTQRKQIAEQLMVLENRANTIKTIIENMKEGLILLDEKSSILSINRSALMLFSKMNGFESTAESSYIGRKIFELTRTYDMVESTQKVLKGIASDITCEFAGNVYRVFFSPTQQNATSKHYGSIMLFVDITEQDRIEKMRREFSANVSHELKTPLTTISGYAEMLENNMVQTNDIGSVSHKIRIEAQRLVTLIEDIIYLSELDEIPHHKDFEAVDLNVLTQDIIEALALKAQEKVVHIEFSSENTVIQAHKRMMGELLYNLIDNAITYNVKDGSIKIIIDKADDKRTRITISDTGIGIPHIYVDRVFERFFRIDTSRSKKTGGTGLGLSIVKHIVQYHSGSIMLESAEKRGTTITVLL